MKISVTQNHINNGISRECRVCPIALAIQEIRGVDDVRVRFMSVLINGQLFTLPKIATDFILSFDAGHDVCPFEFELPGC